MTSERTRARRAVFLDRDGVVVEDRGPLTRLQDVRLVPGAALALRALHAAGWVLVGVSNQTAVARGLLDEAAVVALERSIEEALVAAGGVALDAFYYCPHHPRATDARYRVACACRKPAPGLLRGAAADLGVDLARSVLVGDRPSDIAAGARAGCTTILVHSGAHAAAPIETAAPFVAPAPAIALPDLASAARWILAGGAAREDHA